MYLEIFGDPNLNTPGIDRYFPLGENLTKDQIEDLKTRFKFIPRFTFDGMMKEMLGQNVRELAFKIESLKSQVEEWEKTKTLLHGWLVTNNGFIGTQWQNLYDQKKLEYDNARKKHEDLSNEFLHAYVNGNLYTHLLDTFNQVNETEMKVHGITDPWDWESEKAVALYQADGMAKLMETDPQIYFATANTLDTQKAKRRFELETRYSALREPSDPVVGANRSLAIKYLLDQEEFDDVDNIIKLYEQLPENAKGAL